MRAEVLAGARGNTKELYMVRVRLQEAKKSLPMVGLNGTLVKSGDIVEVSDIKRGEDGKEYVEFVSKCLARKIIRGIVNGSETPMSELGIDGKIDGVYTIINETMLFTKFNPMTGEKIPVGLEDANVTHGLSVFAEDIGHDWRVVGDAFRFNAHSSPVGSFVDLLIEYIPN